MIKNGIIISFVALLAFLATSFLVAKALFDQTVEAEKSIRILHESKPMLDRIVESEKNAHNLESESKKLKSDLESRLHEAGKAISAAETARTRFLQIEKELRATIAKTLHDKTNGLTVTFGTPRQWQQGPSAAQAVENTADSSGVVVLNGALDDKDQLVGGIEGAGPNGRVFYEVAGPPVGGRNVSHMLPVRVGDKFKVWGTKAVNVYFFPFKVQTPNDE
jgi:hypothetical protein